jgi:hypothetical protein
VGGSQPVRDVYLTNDLDEATVLLDTATTVENRPLIDGYL